MDCSGGVPLTDRGFRYGQHLFESVAVRDGRALLLAAHLSLLEESAKRNGYFFPKTLFSSLECFVVGTSMPDGMLRIFLTAGEGGPATPFESTGCYLLWEQAHFPSQEEITRGYSLTSKTQPFLGDNWYEKSGNYAEHLKRFCAARSQGFDEAVVFDSGGYLLSCAMANLIVWMRRNGQIIACAPPAERGGRAGAVLEWVKKKIPLSEHDLRSGDLRDSISLAVTNSRLGVMPVSSLDGTPMVDPAHSHALASSYLKEYGLFGRP